MLTCGQLLGQWQTTHTYQILNLQVYDQGVVSSTPGPVCGPMLCCTPFLKIPLCNLYYFSPPASSNSSQTSLELILSLVALEAEYI